MQGSSYVFNIDYLLSVSYVLDFIQGAGDISVNKIEIGPMFIYVFSLAEDRVFIQIAL